MTLPYITRIYHLPLQINQGFLEQMVGSRNPTHENLRPWPIADMLEVVATSTEAQVLQKCSAEENKLTLIIRPRVTRGVWHCVG